MNGRRTPWLLWVVVGVVLLNVFSDAELPVVPLVIAGLVAARILGQRSRGAGGPHRHHRRVGTGRSPDGNAPVDTDDTWASPGQDRGMPTIEVPRYPGDGPAPAGPLTGEASSSQAGAAGSAAGPGAGAPQFSSDPVVSLGQLHLSRCGRDLQAAVRHGSATEVARVLDELDDLSRRMQDMLGAAAGTPGSGRREFQAGLRAIERLVEDARGESPPGAKLTRVTQACLRMGQTGRHE